jgi:subtilisin family serine protease
MKKKFGFLLLLILGFLIFNRHQAFSQGPPERKIVVFKSGVTREKKISLLSGYQATLGKDLHLINGMAVALPRLMAEKLAGEAAVLRIDPDVEVFALPQVKEQGFCDWFPNWPGCRVTPTLTPTPTPTNKPTSTPTPTPDPILTTTPTLTPTPTSGVLQPIPWGVARIRTPEAWGISTGAEIRIAVIDTGVNRSHPDLRNNLVLEGCLNFITFRKTCEDDNGHGTHVSGIIAAENNSFGVVGVAPQSKIYALKVLNRNGSGYLSDIIEALDWAVNKQMQVVNMSLGTSSDVQSFREAVQKANQAGLIQIAAAGNSGGAVIYPAAYPEVIAVSAVDNTDSLASWSSRGSEIDLAAPGVNIYSTYKNQSYKTLSGTSMASPHVAGVVALLLARSEKCDFDASGACSPAEVRQRLEMTAQDLGVPGKDDFYGAGLVNAEAAVTAP